MTNTISSRLARRLNENYRSALRQKHGERGVGLLKVQARLSESVWPERGRIRSNAQASSSLLSFGSRLVRRLLIVFGFVEQAGKSRLTGASVQGVGVTFERDAVEQALDVSGHRIGRHDQGRIDRMNISARDGAPRMAQQSGDGDLCKTQIMGNACETVPQQVRRDLGELGFLESLVPVFRKADQQLCASKKMQL